MVGIGLFHSASVQGVGMNCHNLHTLIEFQGYYDANPSFLKEKSFKQNFFGVVLIENLNSIQSLNYNENCNKQF